MRVLHHLAFGHANLIWAERDSGELICGITCIPVLSRLFWFEPPVLFSGGYVFHGRKQ